MTTWNELNERQKHYFASLESNSGYSRDALIWAWDHIFDRLDDCNGLRCYGADMSFILTERENADGFVDSPYFFDAKVWIKEHFDDCGTCFQHLKDDGYTTIPNPFDEPTGFVVLVYIDVVELIINNTDWVQHHWNERFELSENTIKRLKYEMVMIDEEPNDDEEIEEPEG